MEEVDKEMAMMGCVGIVLFGVTCLFCMGGCYVGSCVEYGDGYRDGVVVKLSDKGVVFKTTEGVMATGGMQFDNGDGGGATTAGPWNFSVRDADAKEQLGSLKPGQRVRVHYRESLSAWAPKGETSYFVTRVEVLPVK